MNNTYTDKQIEILNSIKNETDKKIRMKTFDILNNFPSYVKEKLNG